MTSLPIHPSATDAARRAFAMHDRVWRSNKYVYPVVSRRSKGISIGVNLNPDKVCNYDCIYCSVDRTVAPTVFDVNLAVLRDELDAMLEVCQSGAIYQFDPFDRIPPTLRRINDIAFSGDGEPTTCPQFLDACRRAAELRLQHQMADTKLVVITNATMFHRPQVQEAFGLLDHNNGEIWAKLDAGTQDYFDLIDRSALSLERICEQITQCAIERPIVIQSLFMNVHGVGPRADEIAAYAGRLRAILARGGKLKLIQIYTVARMTTEAYATALSIEQLQGIAGAVADAGVAVPIEVYG
jgi:wyosine [tRNA(Phe)-imidazoG37] synthetase (radical SAM superfamily)